MIAFDAPGVRAWQALPAGFPAAAAVERPEDGRPGDRPQLWLDDRAAAAQATRYLLGLGHETVHYLAIPSSTTRIGQRTEGWRDGLRAAGKPLPEPLDAAGALAPATSPPARCWSTRRSRPCSAAMTTWHSAYSARPGRQAVTCRAT